MTKASPLCDCHSHAYGPYARFPLAESPTFVPPESPIEALEQTWQKNGVGRAVLIQGSAHGLDHSALLHAIARDPERRRGIAILPHDVPETKLIRFHEGGIRGVRFNLVRHLRPTVTLEDAAILLRRIQGLGWHGELHIDADSLELVERLGLPSGCLLVIDHMARIDASLGLNQTHFTRLLRLLEKEQIWIKLSGADRVAGDADLQAALPFIKALIRQVPEKCVWGLDWPHVNLPTKRSDHELMALIQEAAPTKRILRQIMLENPGQLYGFSLSQPTFDPARPGKRGTVAA